MIRQNEKRKREKKTEYKSKGNAYYKKATLALLLLCLTVFLFACAGEQKEGIINANAENGEKTRIVIDCIGREVEIPDNVERVACLYAFAGHVTAIVGETDKLVAVVSGLKRDLLLTAMFPSILDAEVPYTEGSINIEQLVATDPDVVFVRESTYQTTEEMKKMEAFDLPVVVIDSNTIEEQRNAVAVAGAVFGGEAVSQAEKYDAFFQEAIDQAEARAADLPSESVVSVFHSINEATRTDRENTLPAQWMEIVGVRNVSAGEELSALEGKSYAGLEQIYLWDPQVIVCNEPGVPEYIRTDAKWAALSAVKNDKVYQMPIGISRWGHPGSAETPLAIYWLGKLIYPELYEDINVEQKAMEFYRTFFHYELTEQDLSGMMSGEGMRTAQ